MASNNQLHIANDTSERLYVVAGPNAAYAWADILVSAGMTAIVTVATAGTGTAPAAAVTADAIVTVSRLAQAIRLFKAIQALGSIYGNLNRWGIIAGDLKNKMTVAQAEQELNSLRALLKEKGAVIEPGTYQEVWRVFLPNPLRYLGPSGWVSVTGGNDVTLLIANESLTRVLFYDSNSDESWIVKQNVVVRAQYGKIWVEDPAQGFFRIPVSNTLLANQRLLPGECLSSLNQNYDFVYQDDGNAVIYQRDGAHDAKPVWASNTYAPGKAGKVLMQDDGNFVVYDVNGAAVAASASNGTGRRIVLEDDGRLVIYDEQGNAQWDSQKSQMRKA